MKMNLTMMAAVALAISNSSAIASTLPPDVSNPGGDNDRPDAMMLLPDREFPPASASENMMVLPATGNHGEGFGRHENISDNMGMGDDRPDHVAPVNPPFDTPASNNWLEHAPDMIPAPDFTPPGSDFGQVVVPVPAAVWLFGSGLLGLIGLGQRRKR